MGLIRPRIVDRASVKVELSLRWLEGVLGSPGKSEKESQEPARGTRATLPSLQVDLVWGALGGSLGYFGVSGCYG